MQITDLPKFHGFQYVQTWRQQLNCLGQWDKAETPSWGSGNVCILQNIINTCSGSNVTEDKKCGAHCRRWERLVLYKLYP